MTRSLKMTTLIGLFTATSVFAKGSVSTQSQANNVTISITGEAAETLYTQMNKPLSVETSSDRGHELTIKQGVNMSCRELTLLSIAGANRGEVEDTKYECTTTMSANGALN